MARVIPVVLDVESFWSATHSLSKMSPIEYVMHPETELISCAIKIDGGDTEVIFGEEEITRRLRSIDWSDKLVIAHNNEGFDAMLLAWRCGVRPKMWGCTLAMARPIHAKTAGGSLAALVEHYSLGKKDATALHNTKGRHLKDFTAQEISDMSVYNKMDVDQCWGLFKVLLPLTSKEEMILIDQTIRMLVEPKFVVDKGLLQRTLAEEKARKKKMVLDLANMLDVYYEEMDENEATETVCKILGSAAKFGQLLRDLGAEVPTKISPTTGRSVPALAKTDAGLLALKESDNEVIAAACEARLGIKSTLLESRIEAFLQAAEAAGGKLPIPTKYYGADTTGRRSGWAYNPLNLPRINPKKAKLTDALRNSMQAGQGKKVIVADLSGIELRVNHFLWKVPSSMALYNADPEKADLYKEFAAQLYQVTKDEVSSTQRQVGKVAHLGLGFGAGALTFQKVAKIMGGVDLTLDEARAVVDKWRAAYPEIVAGWKNCHQALRDIFLGIERPIDPWGLCWTCKEGIRTPKGMIRYPDLREEDVPTGKVFDDGTPETKREWVYGHGRNKARIYAGKVTENIVQHLARTVIADAAIEIRKQKAINPALEVYDELVYVEDEGTAPETLDFVQSVLRTPPKWWPELVTWSEGDIADTYGAAK